MSLDETLKERNRRYGDFTDHAQIAQRLQDVMRGHDGWNNLNAVQKQSLTVIADKIARIINGDPNYIDSFRDIAGYAKLVMQRLESQVGATDTRNILITRTEDGWRDEAKIALSLQEHENEV